MGGLQIADGSFCGLLVGIMSIITGILVLITGGVLRKVSMRVTFHLVVENLGFCNASLGKEEIADEFEDFLAVFIEFIFNFSFVASKEVEVLGALLFFFFFNGGKLPAAFDGTPAHVVHVGNGIV